MKEKKKKKKTMQQGRGDAGLRRRVRALVQVMRGTNASAPASQQNLPRPPLLVRLWTSSGESLLQTITAPFFLTFAWNFCPFVPAHGQPLDPTSDLIFPPFA